MFLSGCVFEKENTPIAQGGGSETTLSGRVVDASGAPVSGAAIRIRLQSDLPPNLFSGQSREVAATPQTYSGPDGNYRVDGLASGSYFVECRAARGLAALLPAELLPEDSVLLPDAVLLPTGAIKGRVTVRLDSNINKLFAAYVYLLGTGKGEYAQDSTGHTFLLTDVPAGAYTLRAQAAIPQGSLPLEHPGTHRPDRSSRRYLGSRQPVPARTLHHARPRLHPRLRRRRGFIPGFAGFRRSPGTRLGRTAFRCNRQPHHRCSTTSLATLSAYPRTFSLSMPWNTSISSDVRTSAWNSPRKFPTCPISSISASNGYNLSGLPAWTGTFPSLTNLYFTDTKTFPEWIYEIPTLVSVSVGDSIASVPKGISKLKNLRYLGLGNHISIFPSELLRMPSLEGVNLRYNRICETTAEEKAFLDRQDSIIFAAETDPIMSPVRDTLKWEETQNCGEP